VSAQLIIGICAFVGMSACGMLSTFVFFDIVEQVNEQLPTERHFAPLGWYWTKYQKLGREYKRLYPDGRLLRKVRILMIVALVCGVICFLALHDFHGMTIHR
jgi:hypothetical protein